jgi:O-antigen/teichoic acid export membrane protein
MAIGLIAIPLLIQGLGVARFGVLSLAWIVIGYFSLFDLGIGRALTKLVADKLGANEEHSIPPLAWTSLLLMFLLGVLAGSVTCAISPWLVQRALKVPIALQNETLRGFYLLAVSIPMVTTTAGFRGILEALQRFRTLNLIRVPMSVFSFAGPLLVLPFSKSLVPVIGILVAGRFIAVFAHLFACFRVMPELRRTFVLKRSLVVQILKFGSWLTIGNLLAPVIVYLDRFLLSALLSVSAVAYYTVPFDVVTRLLVFPGAVVGVLFPAFAVSLLQDPNRAGLLLNRGVKYVFLVVFPIVLVAVTLAPEALRLWLGPAFAENGSVALRWLAAGMFVNCLAQVPFSLIQGAGRPDITSKVVLAELPLYLWGLRVLVKSHGIEGASIAMASRVTVEAAFVFCYANRLLPHRPRFLVKVGTAVTGGLLVLCAATLPHSLTAKIAFVSLSLFVFGLATWRGVLTPQERAYVLGHRSTTATKSESLADVC